MLVRAQPAQGAKSLLGLPGWERKAASFYLLLILQSLSKLKVKMHFPAASPATKTRPMVRQCRRPGVGFGQILKCMARESSDMGCIGRSRWDLRFSSHNFCALTRSSSKKPQGFSQGLSDSMPVSFEYHIDYHLYLETHVLGNSRIKTSTPLLLLHPSQTTLTEHSPLYWSPAQEHAIVHYSVGSGRMGS